MALYTKTYGGQFHFEALSYKCIMHVLDAFFKHATHTDLWLYQSFVKGSLDLSALTENQLIELGLHKMVGEWVTAEVGYYLLLNKALAHENKKMRLFADKQRFCSQDKTFEKPAEAWTEENIK